MNTAVVSLKPHAANAKCAALIEGRFAEAGVQVVSKGSVGGAAIDAEKLVDQHYGTLATAAMTSTGAELELSDERKAAFEALYGVPWAAARKITNPAAMAELSINGVQLEAVWRKGKDFKIAPGTYLAELTGNGLQGRTWTVNGFYLGMREEFVSPTACVNYYVVQFDMHKTSWASFRGGFIGATEPSEAVAGSVRRACMLSWEELGLATKPSKACNCVHASAGPLEALKERIVWAGHALETDSVGAALLEANVPLETLQEWMAENPVVEVGSLGKGKIFDITEGLDTADMLLAFGAAFAPARAK